MHEPSFRNSISLILCLERIYVERVTFFVLLSSFFLFLVSGIAYALGLGCEKSLEDAILHWKRAGLGFEANSIFFLGLVEFYSAEGDKSRAVEYFESAKGKGHLEASYRLGLCHLNGIGTQQDALKAANCFIEGSESFHMASRFELATLYWYGIGTSVATGVEQNFDKAIKLFKEAYEGGELSAKEYIDIGFKNGLCLENGERKKESRVNVERDPERNFVVKSADHFTRKIDYGACRRCGKKLSNKPANDEMCEMCVENYMLIKRDASMRECQMCFTGDSRLFLSEQRMLCMVCGNDVVDGTLKTEEMAMVLKDAGNEFFKKAKYEEACRYYEKALECQAMLSTQCNLVASLYMGKRFCECRELANSVLRKQEPRNVKILILCARSCREVGLFDEAKQKLKEAMLLDPKVSPQCEEELHCLSNVLSVSMQMAANVVSGNLRAALTCYLRAPESVKANHALRFAVMDVHFRLGHFEDVAKEAKEVERLDLPLDFRAHVLHMNAVARLYTSTAPSMNQLLLEVEKAIQMSSKGSADWKSIKESQGKIKLILSSAEQADNVEDMRQCVAKIENLDPMFVKSVRFGVMCLEYVEKLLSKGDIESSLDFALKTVAFTALTEHCLKVFEKAAQQAFRIGDSDSSIRYYTLCMDISFPPSETILYGRGCAFQKKGMYVDALRDFTRLAELRPSSSAYTEARESARHAANIPRYYVVLGVSLNATSKQIKKAFKKLALATHPDKLENSDDAGLQKSTAMFREISEAYVTLSDPKKRMMYDKENFVSENEND